MKNIRFDYGKTRNRKQRKKMLQTTTTTRKHQNLDGWSLADVFSKRPRFGLNIYRYFIFCHSIFNNHILDLWKFQILNNKEILILNFSNNDHVFSWVFEGNFSNGVRISDFLKQALVKNHYEFDEKEFGKKCLNGFIHQCGKYNWKNFSEKMVMQSIQPSVRIWTILRKDEQNKIK